MSDPNEDLDRKRQFIYDCKKELSLLALLEEEYVQEIDALQTSQSSEATELCTKIRRAKEDLTALKNENEMKLLQKNEALEAIEKEISKCKIVPKPQLPKQENVALAKQNEKLKKKRSMLTDNVTKIQTSIDDLRKQNITMENNVKDIIIKIDGLKKQDEGLLKELNTCKNKNQNLQEEIFLNKLEIETLKNIPLDAATKGNSLFAEVEDSRLKTSRRLQQLKNKYKEMKQNAQSKLKQMAFLQKQNAELSNQLLTIDYQDAEYETIINGYRTQIELLEKDIEDYSNKIAQEDTITVSGLSNGASEFVKCSLRSKRKDCEKARQNLNKESQEKLISTKMLKEANVELQKKKCELLNLKIKVSEADMQLLEAEISELQESQKQEKVNNNEIFQEKPINSSIKLVNVDENSRKNALKSKSIFKSQIRIENSGCNFVIEGVEQARTITEGDNLKQCSQSEDLQTKTIIDGDDLKQCLKTSMIDQQVLKLRATVQAQSISLLDITPPNSLKKVDKNLSDCKHKLQVNLSDTAMNLELSMNHHINESTTNLEDKSICNKENLQEKVNTLLSFDCVSNATNLFDGHKETVLEITSESKEIDMVDHTKESFVVTKLQEVETLSNNERKSPKQENNLNWKTCSSESDIGPEISCLKIALNSTGSESNSLYLYNNTNIETTGRKEHLYQIDNVIENNKTHTAENLNTTAEKLQTFCKTFSNEEAAQLSIENQPSFFGEMGNISNDSQSLVENSTNRISPSFTNNVDLGEKPFVEKIFFENSASQSFSLQLFDISEEDNSQDITGKASLEKECTSINSTDQPHLKLSNMIEENYSHVETSLITTISQPLKEDHSQSVTNTRPLDEELAMFTKSHQLLPLTFTNEDEQNAQFPENPSVELWEKNDCMSSADTLIQRSDCVPHNVSGSHEEIYNKVVGDILEEDTLDKESNENNIVKLANDNIQDILHTTSSGTSSDFQNKISRNSESTESIERKNEGNQQNKTEENINNVIIPTRSEIHNSTKLPQPSHKKNLFLELLQTQDLLKKLSLRSSLTPEVSKHLNVDSLGNSENETDTVHDTNEIKSYIISSSSDSSVISLDETLSSVAQCDDSSNDIVDQHDYNPIFDDIHRHKKPLTSVTSKVKKNSRPIGERKLTGTALTTPLAQRPFYSVRHTESSKKRMNRFLDNRKTASLAAPASFTKTSFPAQPYTSKVKNTRSHSGGGAVSSSTSEAGWRKLVEVNPQNTKSEVKPKK